MVVGHALKLTETSSVKTSTPASVEFDERT